MTFTKEQERIIKNYIKATQKRKRHLSRREFADEGFNKNKVEYHFGSLSALKDAAREYEPSAFKGIIDGELYDPTIYAEMVQSTKKFKRFVITTAVMDTEVHKGFYTSLQTYCKTNDAMLLVLAAADPSRNLEWNKHVHTIDSVIPRENLVLKELALNTNLFLSTVKLGAKHIDPITSLIRIGQRNGSFIFASPKQRLKLVPTSNIKLPHAAMTTGAITVPNYNTERYMSERTAYIAKHDHVLGAIIVEIVDNKRYHFRQIQADRSGGFADLGKFYNAEQVSDMSPEALVLGDYHSGQTDPDAEKVWFDVIKELKPETLVLHDVFNGLSISHHCLGKNVSKAFLAIENKLNLEQELKRLTEDLNKYSKLVDRIVIVKGNHDEFLERYLEEARYVQDPQNHYLALKLAVAMIEGKDPLKFGVEMMGLSNPDKIKWLTRDEDFKVARIQLGSHGDLGANGAKGSLRAMENAYENSVTGHSHSAEILRGAWQVGTSSFLRMGYNRGPNSWSHTSCLVYSNGERQLINAIEGKWRLE